MQHGAAIQPNRRLFSSSDHGAGDGKGLNSADRKPLKRDKWLECRGDISEVLQQHRRDCADVATRVLVNFKSGTGRREDMSDVQVEK